MINPSPPIFIRPLPPTGDQVQVQKRREPPGLAPIPLSPSSVAALSTAEGMRRAQGASKIHMEHLLLGLYYSKPEGPTRRAFKAAELSEKYLLEALNQELDLVLPVPETADLEGTLPPLSKHTRAALEQAETLAHEQGDERIRTRHLLAGFWSVERCTVVNVVKRLAPDFGAHLFSSILESREPEEPGESVEPGEFMESGESVEPGEFMESGESVEPGEFMESGDFTESGEFMDSGEFVDSEESEEVAAEPEEVEKNAEAEETEETEGSEEARVQPLANDVPQGPDLLAIESEVQALAEAIALKEMRPPLVVGVLGGWGAGKSFVLHLLEEHLGRIRCENLTPGGGGGESDRESEEFPYIGHPYVIRFDAWTYAKADLWASLMQSIFVELNRQLGLEQRLHHEFDVDPRTGAAIWRLLSRLSPAQLAELQEDPLARNAIAKLPALEREVLEAEDLWLSLEHLKTEERRALETSEKALAEQRRQLELARLALDAAVEEEIAQSARQEAFAPFRAELQSLLGTGWQAAWEERPPEFDELTRELSAWRRLRQGWSGGATAFALFALVAVLSPWLLGHAADLGQQAVAWLSGALATVFAHLETLRGVRRWLEERQVAYRRRLEEAQEQRNDTRDRLREEKLQVQKTLLAAAAEEDPEAPLLIPALERKVRELEAEVDGHRRNVGLTARHPSLLDFVRGRLESGIYDQRLGILHQAQRDLSDLTAALLHHPTDSPAQQTAREELFPRGEPRVILMIDDLDRCPPDRVVAVLEAAQLLVKTRLFVVVLAMDVRYITRALEKVYAQVLTRGGEPSGLDYIEKIVQIPYRVRPIRKEALHNFLRAQMNIADAEEPDSPESVVERVDVEYDDLAAEISRYALEAELELLASPPPELERGNSLGVEVAAPPPTPEEVAPQGPASAPAPSWLRGTLPTRVQEFRPEEFELLNRALGAVDISPRAARRLVNVCKLLKIIWYRRGLGEGPPRAVKQAMLGLLAAAAHHPEVLRDLLVELERAFYDEPDTTHLLAFLHKRSVAASSVSTARRKAAQNTLARVLPKGLALRALGRDNLTLVSSFSFVGESEVDSGES